MQTLGDALAAYQQVLVTGNSPFDQWLYGQQQDAISADARLGYEIFSGKCVLTSNTFKLNSEM